ncbi:hypothetical protein COCCADRAFT_92007 [Bipolaris zeicola 26-R-13]|uniref:Transmembrane protein n=1 Tax=Cochliobolus carbonum (strain 26-R-13) TaxID=930089 RepID=W6YU08_COCC2|nr:uncharacterized protein COCCADRAFT_92007 [Bipolaris zeicola 26-R-13]EUC35001.1 hypothetical protein COCCADRAFT_92007 [Bipolaris zeicola 26-R-13]
MAKSNRLPRRVRLGAVSIRFPEAHFSWAPQGMMSMFLAFGSSSSSLLQTYLDVVVVRPFWVFFSIGTGTSCLSCFFCRKLYTSLLLVFLLFGGRGGRNLYCLLVFYPFRYEGIDRTGDKIHC